MRDLLVTFLILAPLPAILVRPAWGVLMWVWVSVMNPHRLAYGFAYGMPFAAIVGGATLIGLVFTKDRRRLPLTPVTVTLMLFVLWICISSLFAIHPETSRYMWLEVMKILVMVFVAMTVLHSRAHMRYLVWVLVISLGFYGVKGGIFTLATAGNYIVWGPPGSFIEGNNELALALIMTIPLMRLLQIEMQRAWQRWAMTGAMLLTALAAIGSHSRGGFLAIIVMALFFWLIGQRKWILGPVLIAVGAGIIAFMPPEWMARIDTISTYQQDASAMGRINAWHMAYNLARAHGFGGGFDIYTPDVFAAYAPVPTDVHAAHSIYFQVLGEHGFVGLALYVLLWFLTWRGASWVNRESRRLPDAQWICNLCMMIQVSLVGYAVGGAFLSLAYFDLPYYLLVLVVISKVWVRDALAVQSRDANVRATTRSRVAELETAQ